MTEILTGALFADMVISGSNSLANKKSEIDDLNVFPVPDGDTGTNMSLTMQSCVNDVASSRDKGLGTVAKVLSSSALRGARGNSGVITSQLMRGIAKRFSGCDSCGKEELAEALRFAANSAYAAVMKPTEGTILTVARALAEGAEGCVAECEDIVSMLELAIEAGNSALERTPELLPQLKQAGVVDAGGKGLMCFWEGALSCLKNGVIVERIEEAEKTESTEKAEFEAFEDIKFKYCTEFLIHKAKPDVDVFRYKTQIERHGDCMVVIDDDDIVKTHIHTNEPNIVIGEALKLGELSKIKIDNMKLQHENRIVTDAEIKEEEAKPPVPPKKYGFISVAAGDGIANVMTELGIDIIIEGGQTMNPSAEDILNAVEALNAENIFVFPNNKNVILSAEQAKNLTSKNVIVVPTKSITQAISCMIAFDEDDDFEENAELFEETIQNVCTGQITYAVRNTVVDDKKIKQGDILGIVDGKIAVAKKTLETAFFATLDKVIENDKETVTVFYGKDVYEKDLKDIEDKLEKKYGDYDISVQYGGQSVYYYIISAE